MIKTIMLKKVFNKWYIKYPILVFITVMSALWFTSTFVWIVGIHIIGVFRLQLYEFNIWSFLLHIFIFLISSAVFLISLQYYGKGRKDAT